MEQYFDKAVLYLLKSLSLDEIKKIKGFDTVPNEYWKKFEKNNIELKINQKYVLEMLKKDNTIKTGIHCQATGCGKSYIILMYCDYFKKFNMSGNIIIFTERVNILTDFF
jgi:superfamily II DNA or RNA helicase